MAGNSNSGRHRKSVASLTLRGGYRANRHANRIVEVKAVGRPIRPETLDASELWLWNRVVEPLANVSVLKEVDTPHVWAMCELWSLYRSAAEKAKVDPLYKDARIAVVSYWGAFQLAAAKCGLSPADRAKLTLEPEKRPDEFEEFLSQA